MDTRGRAVAVIGGGAVGSILAAHLEHAGQETILVECGDRFAQIDKVGLKISGKANISTKPTRLVRTVEALEEHRDRVGACFLCTKTWSLRETLPALAKVVNKSTLVLSFQNGIGAEEELKKHFPAERVGRAILNFAGGVSPQTGEVVMQWFNPPNHIGMTHGDPPRITEIIEAFNSAGLVTQSVPCHDIKEKVFFKTILNAALNALCATSSITMRQAMTYPNTRSLARLLIREGLSVASAVGYTYGEDVEATCLSYLDKGGDHMPSMWQDLKVESPTEIEFINGKIVEIGSMFRHIDVTANKLFTSLIITQEIKSGVRKPDDIPTYLTNL